MNSDRELAEYMARSLRSQKLRAITDAISPDFVFFSPRVKGYDFEQYCQHLEKLSVYIEAKILDVVHIGDVFIIDVDVQTVDIQRDYFHNGAVKMLVTITDHLVKSIEFKFEATPEEDAYMEEINPIPDKFKPS
ncbi:MAG: hypothetical protein OCD03_02555 [Hyphomicrobiales bacterium]